MQNDIINEIETIINLRWDVSQSATYSLSLLFQEYVRRSVIWSRHFEKEWKRTLSLSFLVDTEFTPDAETMNRLTSLKTLGSLTTSLCHEMVRWLLLKSSGGLDNYELVDPYAPLQLCFERGGFLLNHHGYFYICNSNGFERYIPTNYGSYADKPPFVELSPQILNGIDENWGK